LNGFGGSSQVPWLGVNTAAAPNTYRADARLSKILPITERFTATLNFEVFNLTNTPTITGMTSRGYTATGLNISPACRFGYADRHIRFSGRNQRSSSSGQHPPSFLGGGSRSTTVTGSAVTERRHRADGLKTFGRHPHKTFNDLLVFSCGPTMLQSAANMSELPQSQLIESGRH